MPPAKTYPVDLSRRLRLGGERCGQKTDGETGDDQDSHRQDRGTQLTEEPNV